MTSNQRMCWKSRLTEWSAGVLVLLGSQGQPHLQKPYDSVPAARSIVESGPIRDTLRPPSFEDYPAGPIYGGKIANPDFATNPGARRFQTVIRERVKNGPNFAGRYTLVWWGCGTGCQSIVVVNDSTGTIYDGVSTSNGPDVREDSRLMIDSPGDDTPSPGSANCSSHFYIWEGSAFREVKLKE